MAAMSDNNENKSLRTVEGRVVSNKIHAHDADNACKEGDVVRVTEIAPMSKTKNWRVVEVITRAAE
jgi:small subunit ribosomal protein S17